MDIEHLLGDAQYGNLPFDRFVLGKWDHSKDRTGDQQQWNDLAREWLALTPRERHPYHELSAKRPQPDASVPVSEQYDRVLVPFQTVRERNLAQLLSRSSPVWLRTCYNAELVEDYEAMSPSEERYGMLRDDHIFDDEAIYGHLATDWTKILLRVPFLTDTVQYIGDADLANIYIPEEPWDEPEVEGQRPVYEAEKVIATTIYLVDEEALRDNIVKLLWLDCHGECVWDNRILPKDILVLGGQLGEGFGLAELVGCYTIQDQDHPAYERGSYLSF